MFPLVPKLVQHDPDWFPLVLVKKTVSRDIVFFLRAELFKSVLSVSALKAPDFFSVLMLNYFKSKYFLTTLKTLTNFNPNPH